MKKLTRALFGVLIGTTALCSVAAFTACNSDHVHSWDDGFTVDKAATCTEDGSKSIHCKDCDATRDVTPIPAGHSWDADFTVDTPAGCAAGSKSIHCANCDATKDVTPIPAVHNWDDEFTVDKDATCTKDGSKSIHCSKCEATKDATPILAHHSWSEWTVTAPTTSKTGTATRTCSGKDCDASDDLKTVTLPKLSDTGYTKTDDTATCGAAGVIRYTYTFNDEPISFDVATKATGNHTVDNWTTTKEPTCGANGTKSGHCSVCDNDVTGTIPATGKHTPTGQYDSCSVCGAQPQKFDYTVAGNSATLNFTVKAGEWCTAIHQFGSMGYVVYTYNGTSPLQVWYSTYGNGKLNSGNATVNNGDSFFMPSSNRGTGYFAFKSTATTDITGSFTCAWQREAPVMPTALTLGTHNVTSSADSDDPSTFYEFIATEEGSNGYVLYCDDKDAIIMVKTGADSDYSQATLPYAFTLAKGEKISFQTLVDFGCSKTSYSVTLAMGAVHEHNWSGWTEKSPADCTNAKIEQRDCLDADCPTNGHEERTVGDALGHTMTAHPATPASCTANGNDAYWTCDVCHKIYGDANGTNELSAIPVTTAEHDYALTVTPDASGNGGTVSSVCSVCRAVKTSYDYDNKVDANCGSAPTVTLSSGTNLMHINRGTMSATATNAAHWVSFTADKTGTYKFMLTYVMDYMVQYRGGIKVNNVSVPSAKVKVERNGSAIVSIELDLNEGDVCTINLGAQLPVGMSEVYYLLTPTFIEA